MFKLGKELFVTRLTLSYFLLDLDKNLFFSRFLLLELNEKFFLSRFLSLPD